MTENIERKKTKNREERKYEEIKRVKENRREGTERKLEEKN